jgi:hypothetical protein
MKSGDMEMEDRFNIAPKVRILMLEVIALIGVGLMNPGWLAVEPKGMHWLVPSLLSRDTAADLLAKIEHDRARI